MACCFLHYLVILLIRLSDQHVRFRIKILIKFTVTQWRKGSEFCSRSRSRYRLYRWDFAFYGGNSDLYAQYLMRGFYFRIQSPSCHTEFARVESIEKDDWTQWRRCYSDAYVRWSCRTGPSWVKITDFSLFLKNIVPFRQFSCIYLIRHRTFCRKEIHTNYRMWKLFTWPYITPSTVSEHPQNGVSFDWGKIHCVHRHSALKLFSSPQLQPVLESHPRLGSTSSPRSSPPTTTHN